MNNLPKSVNCTLLWGESKLAKVVCPGSLLPGFVNNDHATAEIIYSTARVHHRRSAGGHWRPCTGHRWELHRESPVCCIGATLHWGYIITPWFCYVTYVMVILWQLPWLLHQPGERLCHASVPTGRKSTCLWFPRLLESPSRLLARALPTLGSANTDEQDQQYNWRCEQN